MESIFIVGTDTDIGKTFVSTLFTYKLGAKGNYYKPIQSGCNEGNSFTIPDVEFVCSVCRKSIKDKNLMNTYALSEAISPHLAAQRDKVYIDKEKIMKDFTNLKNKYDYMVIEGAGGAIVPILRNNYYMYDLIKELKVPVVIVASSKIGSINHTMLTIEYLKSKNIKINGIVFNNYSNNFYEDDNISVILESSDINCYLKLDKMESTSIEDIRKYFNTIDESEIKKFF
ncbi:MAG: dethiobiotin synthase [Clostridium sp.]